MRISPEVCDTATPIGGIALPSAVVALPSAGFDMERFDG